MTVLTKFVTSEKKDQLPLVDENSLNETRSENPEEPVLKYVVIHKSRQSRKRRVGNFLCCLFLMALLVASVGVLGGLLLYRQYGAVSAPRFSGWCAIPYDTANSRAPLMPQFRITSVPETYFASSRDVELLNDVPRAEEMSGSLPDFLSESFDIRDDYERIIVSDFRDGRHSNVLHDFASNMSGIVDSERCFVYPINRKVVMQPDLFISAIQGQSEFDLSTVHDAMRAVIPALIDLSNLGRYIGKECATRPVYMLQKQDGTIRKRSAEIPNSAKFAQFSGKHVQEIDVVNIDELLAYEENAAGTV